MATPMKTVRRNPSYSFLNSNLDSLGCLAKKITPDEATNFRKEYGYILSLLKMPFTKYEQEGVHTLLQFYNPSLRCFTFTDYLLVPTLEEYSLFLGIHIKKEVAYYSTMKAPDSIEIAKALYLSKSVVEANLTKKGGGFGFCMEFLVKRGCEAAEAKEWDTFRAILALSIYGIVSHLPERGAFVDNRHTSKWAERIMGLRAKDIVWYNKALEDREIIMSCGRFKNVPLMGLRGGINYNPVLARRTFGYAFISPPEQTEIAENIFYHVATDNGQMAEAVQAWKSICWRDKKYFGQRDCATYEDYTKWIESVVAVQGMPFPPKDPLYPPAEKKIKEHYEAQLADLTKRLQIQTENANSEKSRRKKADKLLLDRQNTIEKCYEEIRKLKGQIREKDQSNAQVQEEARNMSRFNVVFYIKGCFVKDSDIRYEGGDVLGSATNTQIIGHFLKPVT
ncbi:uncharacterized protein LOC131650837 [Vicia villosa]|uniref:uncharacterized protein LOC131650837 n=1 Tax=Vicia villosa TaxID=3911 RepID=UPI00273AAE32|nr:uncharacterized protein LOC131650837 [Vicia villosa]